MAQPIHHNMRNHTRNLIHCPECKLQIPRPQRRRRVRTAISLPYRPLRHIVPDVRQTLVVVRPAGIRDLSVVVAVNLQEGLVRAPRVASDGVGGGDAVGGGVALVEGA